MLNGTSLSRHACPTIKNYKNIGHTTWRIRQCSTRVQGVSESNMDTATNLKYICFIDENISQNHNTNTRNEAKGPNIFKITFLPRLLLKKQTSKKYFFKKI